MMMTLTLALSSFVPQTPAPLTSVAGVYELTGAVERDTCRSEAPASVFSVVVQAPGGRALVVELGGPPSPR